MDYFFRPPWGHWLALCEYQANKYTAPAKIKIAADGGANEIYQLSKNAPGEEGDGAENGLGPENPYVSRGLHILNIRSERKSNAVFAHVRRGISTQ